MERGDAKDIDGQTERSNGASGKSDIEGKAMTGSRRASGRSSPKRRSAFRVAIAGPKQSLTTGNQDGDEVLEGIAGNLTKAGWSYGYVSALDRNGRTNLDRRRSPRGKALHCARG
jgi:hypothetical protein